MAANVESMFFVGRETPWHGLGTSIETAPTSKDAIVCAGLDWNVIQSDIFTENGTLVKGFKANIRETDKKVLGMVTDKYKIVQNIEAFEFTDALLGEGVTYETAGSLASGKRIWMLARMEDRIVTGERMSPYLVFTNSHDGKGAINVAITPVRVVCQNTLNLALKSAERKWSCVHMGDIKTKLEEAKRTLLNAETYMETLHEEFGELKLKTLTDDKVDEYINLLFPLDENETSLIKINRAKQMREELRIRYFEAPDLRDIEKSAYRFVNAVSDFATHTIPFRRTQNFAENRFIKTVDGNALIDKAYAMMREVA